MINQFYKRKILTTGFANCSKGKKGKKTKHQNAQHRATTTTSQSMAIE